MSPTCGQSRPLFFTSLKIKQLKMKIISDKSWKKIWSIFYIVLALNVAYGVTIETGGSICTYLFVAVTAWTIIK